MGLSPKEQADFTLKTAQLQLEGQKEGRAHAEFQANEEQRRAREHRADRAQYANETKAQKQLRLQQEKLELDKEKLAHEKSKPQPKPASGKK